MTNQEKLRERIFRIILPSVCRLRPEIDIRGAQQAQLLTDEILSDPSICIKAEDQRLPNIPRKDIARIIIERDRILLEAHWVKVEPKEEGG